MSSDIETIRELALKDSVRRADECRRKESEARKLAKAHLPLWVESINQAMRKEKYTSVHFYYNESSGGWFSSAHIYWIGNHRGPSIDLDELFELPVYIYTNELTVLLGKPFEISKKTWEREMSGRDGYGGEMKYWTETQRAFIVNWG